MSPWAFNTALKDVRIKKIMVPKKIISIYSFARIILSSVLPINFKISYEKNVPIKVISMESKNAYTKPL